MDYDHCDSNRDFCPEVCDRTCPGCDGPGPDLFFEDRQLGLLLCNWHSGQWDPVYMTGSCIFSGMPIPTLQVKATVRAVELLLREVKGRRDRRELKTILAGLAQGRAVNAED